jgi:hypothetical protein
MDPITIALGLASVAPTIIKWITGSDKAEDVANQVVGLAKTVAGKDDGSAALAAIKADPALALQFQQSWMAHELGMYQEETKRLDLINQTMRAESGSNDAYVRRMRPTFGYVLAASWGSLMLAITYRIIFNPAQLADMIDSVAKLQGMWEVALSVLGIYLYKRSTDKSVAATGKHPAPILSLTKGAK